MSKVASNPVSLIQLSGQTRPGAEGVRNLGSLAAELFVRALAVSIVGATVLLALAASF